VFRRDGSGGPRGDASGVRDVRPRRRRRLLETVNAAGLRFSVGAYDNLLGGDPGERIKNQNHILQLIRIAHLCGGDANDVTVGTFVGYNHELGVQDGGFRKTSTSTPGCSRRS